MSFCEEVTVRPRGKGAADRRLLLVTVVVVVFTLLAGRHALGATRTWTGTGANANWTTPANWSGNIAPQALDTLVFPAGPIDLTATNNFAAGTTFSSIRFTGTGYVLNGNAITLSGSLVNTAGLGPNTIQFPITLSDGVPPLVIEHHVVNISNALGSISLMGAISGGNAATLEKEGAGTLILTGGASNTYVATTIVNGGTLNLVKQGIGTIAIASALTIGAGVGAANTDVVRFVGNSNQIADTSAISINSSGLLDLNGRSDTIGPLTMFGGNITTAAGTLTLNGDVTATSTATSGLAVINGNLSLGAATRTFDVNQVAPLISPNLVIDAAVSGNAGVGLTKIGSGSLSLFAANSYTGPTVVNAGALNIYDNQALGAASAGTTVNAPASLNIVGISVAGEVLTLSGSSLGLPRVFAIGNCTWSGDIALSMHASIGVESASVLTIGGVISGAGSLDINTGSEAGLLVVQSPNTYTGSTLVGNGTLRLGANGRIPDTSIMDIGSSGTFDVNGVAETIAGLMGDGQVTLGAGSLTISTSVSTTFNGPISGTGAVGLVKTGPGSLTLAGTTSYTGTTTINGGTLFINGFQQSSPTVLNAGVLGGQGISGPLTANSGQVSPGSSPGTLGVIGPITLNAGSVFRVELDGPANTSFDRLQALGPIAINGATLVVSQSFTPAPGTVFTILEDVMASPLSGTFAGLPEGSTLNVDGITLRISYVGGTGNDVTLSFVSVQTYLSEGATGDFFDTQIALVNPSTTAAASATLKYLKSDATTVQSSLTVPALGRRTVNVKDVPGMNPAEFSTVVESDYPLIVDRTMTWNATGYGSHAGTSVRSPEITWYLAEGATHSNFNLFYLIQNPNTSAADVQVTYLLPTPAAPLVKTYTVLPNSRFNIWVNIDDPALAATDVSAVLRSTNGVSIIVERAMYLDAQGLQFGAGHESAAVTAPALNWFLAEGATGDYFDLFVLIANSTTNDAQVTATYLLPSGTTVQKNYVVTARSRFNIWVDLEDPQLAATAVSTTITSTNSVPIIVERAMWWPGGAPTWHEAHNSPGSTETGIKWGLAEGEVGGPRSLETYLLIANTSASAGIAQVTLLLENGTTAGKLFALNPNSRFNVAVGEEFPDAVGNRFGAIIESLGDAPVQIVVERAMYSSVNGVVWAAGTNALATKLQ